MAGTMRIKIVGPCASGKSVLAARLCDLGFIANAAAQDHSYVPDMWRRINPPDLLIYLDVSLEEVRRRGRCGFGWDQAHLDRQNERLRHARAHADLYLSTDGLTEDEVLARVLTWLGSSGAPRFVSAPIAGKEDSMPEPLAVGKVIHYWTRLGVAGVELSDTLRVDDWIQICGVTTDFQQRVTSLQIDRRLVTEAHAGDRVGLLVADRVRVGDTVFRLEG